VTTQLQLINIIIIIIIIIIIMKGSSTLQCGHTASCTQRASYLNCATFSNDLLASEGSGYLSRQDSDYATGWTFEESVLDSRKGKNNSLLLSIHTGSGTFSSLFNGH